MFQQFLDFGFFSSPSKFNFCGFLAQNNVIAKVWLNIFFSLADNDNDISKTHLNQAEQIIKVDVYLRLQNTENFALSASSWCNDLIHSASCSKLMEPRKRYTVLTIVGSP